MQINNRNISRAIEKATGWKDVRVHKADGCVMFYSDNETTSEYLASFYERTVYVNAINHLTVDEWVREFKWLIEQEEEKRGEEFKPDYDD